MLYVWNLKLKSGGCSYGIFIIYPHVNDFFPTVNTTYASHVCCLTYIDTKCSAHSLPIISCVSTFFINLKEKKFSLHRPMCFVAAGHGEQIHLYLKLM